MMCMLPMQACAVLLAHSLCTKELEWLWHIAPKSDPMDNLDQVNPTQ